MRCGRADWFPLARVGKNDTTRLAEAWPLSDFGSRMGAADCVEVRPRAVIVTRLRLLTWPNLGSQVACPPVCSVVVLDVVSSANCASHAPLNHRAANSTRSRSACAAARLERSQWRFPLPGYQGMRTAVGGRQIGSGCLTMPNMCPGQPRRVVLCLLRAW